MIVLHEWAAEERPPASSARARIGRVHGCRLLRGCRRRRPAVEDTETRAAALATVGGHEVAITKVVRFSPAACGSAPARWRCLGRPVVAVGFVIDDQGRLCAKARATATRCCSPPESWLGGVSGGSGRPGRAPRGRGRGDRRAGRVPTHLDIFAGRQRSGIRLRPGRPCRSFDCGTRASGPSLIRRDVQPSTSILAAGGRVQPGMMPSSVDLPEPDGR